MLKPGIYSSVSFQFPSHIIQVEQFAIKMLVTSKVG
jgi:hypothetical protein